MMALSLGLVPQAQGFFGSGLSVAETVAAVALAGLVGSLQGAAGVAGLAMSGRGLAAPPSKVP